MKSTLFGLLCACLSFTVAAEYSLSPTTKPTDLRQLGSANAPFTMYVFSSFSCPHCGTFHKEVLPTLKKEFVDTNQAKIVFVETPFDKYALTATLIARCVSPAKWEDFSGTVYKMQYMWKNSSAAKRMFWDYAQKTGMSETDFNLCLANQDLNRKVTQQRNNMVNLYNVRSLPTVVLEKDGKNTSFAGTDKDLVEKLKLQGLK